MPNAIEEKGIKILIDKLTKSGRIVISSDNKTFDLIVDGKYAEVKTKAKPYSGLDFLSFTDKQYDKILNSNFIIFLVCNLNSLNETEIYEFESETLKNISPKLYTSHEYNKSVLDSLWDKISKL